MVISAKLIALLLVLLCGNALCQPAFKKICYEAKTGSSDLTKGVVNTGQFQGLPKGCWPETKYGYVYCIGNNFTSIPDDLPLSTTCLVIELGNIKTLFAESINYLPNLKVLGILDTSVQKVSGVFNHPELQVLAITGGYLQDVPTVTNGKLVSLNLQSNSISTVDLSPVSGNPIVSLDLSRNLFSMFPTNELEVVGNTLTELYVMPSRVEYIGAGTFSKVPRVQKLQVASYDMKTYTFYNLRLTEVDFQTCKIESYVFHGLDFTSLKLSSKLRCKDPSQGLQIQRYSFSDLMKLESLDLSSTKLRVIPKDAFQGLPALTGSLLIEFNQVEMIEVGAFNGLSRLSQLRLTNNGRVVPDVPVTMFSSAGLVNLTLLDLSNFNLQNIRYNMFQNLPVLQNLYLGFNLLTSLNFEDLQPVLPHLKRLSLYGNPWHCDCHLRWMRELYDTHRYLFDPNSIEFWKCATPADLGGQIFVNVDPDEFKC